MASPTLAARCAKRRAQCTTSANDFEIFLNDVKHRRQAANLLTSLGPEIVKRLNTPGGNVMARMNHFAFRSGPDRPPLFQEVFLDLYGLEAGKNPLSRAIKHQQKMEERKVGCLDDYTKVISVTEAHLGLVDIRARPIVRALLAMGLQLRGGVRSNSLGELFVVEG